MEVPTEPPDSNVNQTIHPSHPENSQFIIIAGVQTVNTRHLNKLVGMVWCWLFQEGSSANAWEGSCTQSYVSRLFSCGCSQLSSGVLTFCITMSYLKCQVRQVLLSESFQGQVLGICNQFWLLADDFQAGPAMGHVYAKTRMTWWCVSQRLFVCVLVIFCLSNPLVVNHSVKY